MTFFLGGGGGGGACSQKPSAARVLNRPYPSSPGPLFQNEGRCSAFDMEIIFHSHANKINFHKKGCAPSLSGLSGSLPADVLWGLFLFVRHSFLPKMRDEQKQTPQDVCGEATSVAYCIVL